MTVNSPEPTRLAYWLRRLWPLYCFLAAIATFGYALYDSYQIDGDAVASVLLAALGDNYDVASESNTHG
jgi:hypothetical protein